MRVASGAVIAEPIEIIYLTSPGTEPAAVHPRTLILVGANAQCTIVETLHGRR